ncbi:TPA: hypothetical protein ACG3IZ_003561 [Clostridioides difficile]|uniref:hypothetical protein n=1 Tax=Clostridioides difficile TaxID=1496 RepID=UPI001F1C0A7F|nr:hypothetical protein [Clostridioides difficile]
MKDEKLELTEKDLHCIARHLQNEVLEIAFRGNREAPTSCEVCDYLQECKDYFTHIDTFSKLSKITGVKISILKTHCSDENSEILSNKLGGMLNGE